MDLCTLQVLVSRWRCRHAPCETAFVEHRLAPIAAPHAQRTERCGGVVHLAGHAVGARAGERLLERLVSFAKTGERRRAARTC